MKKRLILTVMLFDCVLAYSQIELRRQAFWGASFIPNPDKAGVTVQRIESGSPAQLAGLKDGDHILKANGILFSDPYVFGKTIRSFRAGDKVTMQVWRNDKLMDVLITSTARPLEQYPGIEVTYGSVMTDKGHHVRTIMTKPAGMKGKIPLILVTQWLSCSQVEILNRARMSGTDSLFYHLITKSGYAMMRVEKPGLGDSDGPDCSEVDYESELATYRAAFKAAMKMDFIDTTSIYVLGISIGSASAPLVFQDENIKGLIVTGGFYKTWYEHMLEIERQRLELTGSSPGEITDAMRKYIDFYNDYLHYQMTPEEVSKRKPHLNGIWYEGGAHQYGRPAVYYQQVQQQNVAGAWDKIESPTLVIYGEYDWIMSRVDHELMVSAVNKNHPGKGTLLVIPEMSHNLTVHPTMDDAFKGRNGVYAREVSDQILQWLQLH